MGVCDYIKSSLFKKLASTKARRRHSRGESETGAIYSSFFVRIYQFDRYLRACLCITLVHVWMNLRKGENASHTYQCDISLIDSRLVDMRQP